MTDDKKEYCSHCGERIYLGNVQANTGTRFWLHWNTVQRHCEAPTVAEPRS